jgi:deazaflavin-dependent oxidoreductase (nitroreductase family)
MRDAPAREDHVRMTTEPRDIHAATPPRRSPPIRTLAMAIAPLGTALAGRRWFPLYAIVRHAGRTSGTAYATPVAAVAVPDGWLIPLPFGDRTQWAKNVFAAGQAGLRWRGAEHRIADPAIVQLDDVATLLPGPIRFAARRIGIRQFVRVRRLD